MTAGDRVTAGDRSGGTPVADLGRVHLIGVGGAGMSAIAALLVARGLAVSGSDARDSAVVAALRAAGVDVHVGHDAAHVDDVDTVVVSSAVRETNPELATARARGARVLHRSAALAALMADRRAVAVAGAHGKTTTSAMVSVALLAAGADPSYAIGGTVLADLPDGATLGAPSSGPLAGARHGAGEVFVAEADESDASFLAYRPTVAVVTNVEPDHLDHYGTREAFEQAFRDFAERVVDGGALVACADDAGSRALLAAAARPLRARGARTVGYGQDAAADVVVGDFRVGPGAGSTFTLTTSHPDLAAAGEVLRTELTLAVPGIHNALNAAAAWTAARLLGADPADLRRGLDAFRGTGRRFEHRGTAGGVRVVDNYDHHPTEVAALLRGARPVAAGGRVVVLFQPHLYSRTRIFATEFADALALADAVVVTDVYGAREDPDPDVSGATITDRMSDGAHGEFVADRLAAARRVAELAAPGDLLLTVGAGDVTELADVVLSHLTRLADGADDVHGTARPSVDRSAEPSADGSAAASDERPADGAAGRSAS
ncbi:UDP-N-acetylmuramate--L-alanine ligase [Cellulomonas aerilata]|uniref:UDP-N-acetylmuramate--L-alanine ligase n=1 Tax=Cellulomonas aerilata TaxID=515326 RepID=A0A512DGD6_9CELL|nr:UDP-N-acetylmuramate--L-alanine ligase [Cellulomonas aerilata]GEO35549.1 UDP-N-acetylmuramate--L-alanine ligase [Cellulomonas aerilata]